MAELVAVFAASHGPLIIRNWQNVKPADRQGLNSAFREIGKRIGHARPDVLIMISPDHWTNFSLDNLPSVCIGLGETHDGPPEPWLKDFPHRSFAGHPGLASHLLSASIARDFEPSTSYHLALDHGFCIPLWKAELDPIPPLVPIIINDIEPPMPTIRRCFSWGRLLADAIASYPEDLRVAILATGGISHSIGETTMGDIDEPFDRECIRRFETGGESAVVEFLSRRLPLTGNGAAEMRNWVIAHAAAGARGFELIRYCPVPEVYVGCGFAAWNLAQPK